MRKINIAIIGLGNIGSIYLNTLMIIKILNEKNNCLPVEICFSTKQNKKRYIKIHKSQWLNNYLDATKSKEVDLIVELIGGAEGPAKN